MRRTTPNSPSRQRRRQRGFSLVEVALAVGIVGFGMTVILGCLPVGLISVKDSKIQSAKANIARQLRGELQQISFFKDDSTADTNIDGLKVKEYYYTQEGMRAESSKEAYYSASFSVNDAEVKSAGGNDGATSFLPENARAVEVKLSYPRAAPEANRETTSFSLFLARQRGQ
jgi:uncharacterized protein (TIGR02598 family)